MREMRKVLNEQGQVEGQRKEVNVREHVKTADSNKIIQFVQLNYLFIVEQSSFMDHIVAIKSKPELPSWWILYCG